MNHQMLQQHLGALHAYLQSLVGHPITKSQSDYEPLLTGSQNKIQQKLDRTADKDLSKWNMNSLP